MYNVGSGPTMRDPGDISSLISGQTPVPDDGHGNYRPNEPGTEIYKTNDIIYNVAQMYGNYPRPGEDVGCGLDQICEGYMHPRPMYPTGSRGGMNGTVNPIGESPNYGDIIVPGGGTLTGPDYDEDGGHETGTPSDTYVLTASLQLGHGSRECICGDAYGIKTINEYEKSIWPNGMIKYTDYGHGHQISTGSLHDCFNPNNEDLKGTLGRVLLSGDIATNPNNARARCYRYGDVNLDGIVNVQDIIVIINHILGGDSITDPGVFNLADLDGDGVINILDVVAMMNVVLGH